MSREHPLSVFLLFIIVILAVVGQMAEKGNDLELRTEMPSGSGAISVLVLAVLVALASLVWRIGQPWKK